MDNGTWELVDLSPSCMVVNNMWIYKVNSDTAGDVSRFKSRPSPKAAANALDYIT
jgi:hypothetical protein